MQYVLNYIGNMYTIYYAPRDLTTSRVRLFFSHKKYCSRHNVLKEKGDDFGVIHVRRPKNVQYAKIHSNLKRFELCLSKILDNHICSSEN